VGHGRALWVIKRAGRMGVVKARRSLAWHIVSRNGTSIKISLSRRRAPGNHRRSKLTRSKVTAGHGGNSKLTRSKVTAGHGGSSKLTRSKVTGGPHRNSKLG
jgi:hypothetical protein